MVKKGKQRACPFVLIFVIGLGLLPASAPAQEHNYALPVLTINLETDTYSHYGVNTDLPQGMPKPFIDENGNTLIPLRFLEIIDSYVTMFYIEWIQETSAVIIRYGGPQTDYAIHMQIGSAQFTVTNDDDLGSRSQTHTFMDAAGKPVSPRIINGRTYLPLRALFEQALEFDVEFKNGIIKIDK